MRWTRRVALVLVTVAVALAAAAGAVAQPSSHRVAGSAASAVATAAPDCARGYYKNVSGHCIHSPSSSPAGATAKCSDGTYSYSEHASGTCSHHGGVAQWIHHP